MVPRYQWWGSFRETRGERTRESCAPLVLRRFAGARSCGTPLFNRWIAP